MPLSGIFFIVCDQNVLGLRVADCCARRVFRLGDRSTAWCGCQSKQIDRPYLYMKEECQYKFLLFAMAGRIRCDTCAGIFSQTHLKPEAGYMCLHFRYLNSWFICCRYYWRESLNFKHRFWEKVLELGLLFDVQNAEVFAFWSNRLFDFYVSTDIFGCTNLCTDRVLLYRLYQSNHSIATSFSIRLMTGSFSILVVVSFGLARCPAVPWNSWRQSHWSLEDLFPFQNWCRLSDPFSDSVTVLIQKIVLCSLIIASGFVLASSLMVWEIVRCVKYPLVFYVPNNWMFPYSLLSV